MWVGRAWGLQSAEDAKANKDIVYVTDRPKDDVKPPADLDWELWLGPAPSGRSTRCTCRGRSGTGGGISATAPCPTSAALERPAVLGAQAESPDRDRGERAEAAPGDRAGVDAGDVRVPGKRGDMPAGEDDVVPGREQAVAAAPRRRFRQWDSGVLFVGDKGMLLSDYTKHVLLPEKQFADFERPKPFIEKSRGPLRGVGSRVQDRGADDVQLRVRRLADRVEPPGQRRVPRRQEAGVGRREDEGDRTAPRPTRSSTASTARGGSWCDTHRNYSRSRKRLSRLRLREREEPLPCSPLTASPSSRPPAAMKNTPRCGASRVRRRSSRCGSSTASAGGGRTSPRSSPTSPRRGTSTRTRTAGTASRPARRARTASPTTCPIWSPR